MCYITVVVDEEEKTSTGGGRDNYEEQMERMESVKTEHMMLSATPMGPPRATPMGPSRNAAVASARRTARGPPGIVMDVAPTFRILYTSLEVDLISDINTSANTFQAHLTITTTWTLTAAEHQIITEFRRSHADLREYLSEDVDCPVTIPLNTKSVDISFATDPEVVIHPDRTADGKLQFQAVQSIQGTWQWTPSDNSLSDFPFDRQILPIFLTTKSAARDRFRIILNAKENEIGKGQVPSVFIQDHIAFHGGNSEEFQCHMATVETVCPHIVFIFNSFCSLISVTCIAILFVLDSVFPQFVTPRKRSSTHDTMIKIGIHCTRKWRFHFNQIWVYALIQSLLLLPGYSMNTESIDSRLNYFIALLIAQTVLLSMTTTTWPSLSYFTILDQYYLCHLVLTLLCVIQSALMSAVHDFGPDETAENIDFSCFIGFTVAYCLVNGYYFYSAYKTRERVESRKYQYWGALIGKLQHLKGAESWQSTADEDFVKPPEGFAPDEWRGGVVVYYQSDDANGRNYGEVRDWRVNSKPFKNLPCDLVIDKVVLLFGRGLNRDCCEAFYEQNLCELDRYRTIQSNMSEATRSIGSSIAGAIMLTEDRDPDEEEDSDDGDVRVRHNGNYVKRTNVKVVDAGAKKKERRSHLAAMERESSRYTISFGSIRL